MQGLAGRVAIVTGAGTGIGLATAKRLTADGARVVAGILSADHAPALEGVAGAVVVRADVTVQADVDALVGAALGLGRLDIVVNNAGIMDRFLGAAEVTDDVWAHVLAVNLTGPMMLSRAALAPMLKVRSGVIVNIASVGGLGGGKAGAAYTASKHGIIGLTKSIGATYGPDGIRCTAIAPGGVNTGISMGGEPSKKGYDALKKTLPAMPRMGEPGEIANVVAFLVSDQASFLNGCVITADAGWTAF